MKISIQKLKASESGIAHLLLLLVVVGSLSAVGFIGYNVYKGNSSSASSSNSTIRSCSYSYEKNKPAVGKETQYVVKTVSGPRYSGDRTGSNYVMTGSRTVSVVGWNNANSKYTQKLHSENYQMGYGKKTTERMSVTAPKYTKFNSGKGSVTSRQILVQTTDNQGVLCSKTYNL